MNRRYFQQARCIFCLLLVTALSACVTTGSRDPRDPLENFNRVTFNFNQALDKELFNPIGRAYAAILPDLLDRSISNFFSNLNDFSVIVNDVLQLKLGQAVADIARLVFNTTIGLLGFFDVSSAMGLPKHNEDFGQTLAKWGIDAGPYLVIPLFGPTTLRAASGLGVDGVFLSPVTYVHNTAYTSGLMGLNYIDFKADLLNTGELLDVAAVDEYEFVKSVYLQYRDKLVHDRDTNDDEENDAAEFDDFE